MIDREQAIEMHSSQDTVLAARAPKLVPKGWEGKKFARPRFPDDIFAVLKSDGSYWGPFSPNDFVFDPTTNITTAHDHDSGEPVILRVLGQTGSSVICIDNDGEQVQYTLEQVPDNTLDIQLSH